jgi:plastocyanin
MKKTTTPAVRTVLAAFGLLVAVAACSSSGGAAASASPPPEADLTISAQSSKFDPTTVTLPADQRAEIFFKNLDGLPHNVAIYTDASASSKLFVGEIITNAATLYHVPALTAGQYFFRCDVHPEMVGTVTVGG